MERVVQLTLGWLLAFATAAPVKEDWDIYSFHINSTVTSRYATTVVTSRVVNRVDAPKEINFQVRIPKNAFISNFRMLMEGQMYDGVVKAKEQAQQQYTEAVSRGESAGVVSSVGRTLEEFKTSVTVAALQKVTFELTYEELLKRTLGKYELQIHARPMQPVKDFKMDVYINEKPGITFVQVKGGLSTNALANAITKTHAHNQAWVHFYPTEHQQIMCDSCGPQGMNGDLVISYDVNRDASLGDIKVSGGYFVHHFAPSGLARIPKNVVFIIDRSGSMSGKKMQQTRLALLHILGDLAEEDYFGLITFDHSISTWKRELSPANSENLAAAKEFARHIQDAGSTDINAAVLQGAEMLKRHPREGSASLLILLTDGDPTSGETNLERIQANTRKAINEKYPLYCLGFGFDVNFGFLEKMALENNGAARRIYEDSDADLQLQGFYEEVANPLLTDVTMIYVGGTNLTKTNFSQYYNGSEIVVAGQITDNNIETFDPRVLALSKSIKMEFESEKDRRLESTGTSSDHLQRVWAYLTVKQLLDKELQLSDAEKENVKKEVLELSLKYSFVTPHTSMVVTKPPGENTQVLHKPKEGEVPVSSGGHALLASLPFDDQYDVAYDLYLAAAHPVSTPGSGLSSAEDFAAEEFADYDLALPLPTTTTTTTEVPRTTKDIPVPALTPMTAWSDVFPSEKVEMSCAVQGSSESDWTFTWYRDGQKLNEDSTLSLGPEGSTVTVSPPSQTYTGNYSCRAHHKTEPITTGDSNAFGLTVYANKPQARVTQTPSLTELYIGEPVSFSCMVDKSSGWEYMWYRDGAEEHTSSTYAITSPKPSDSGLYWCRAKRGKGEFTIDKSEKKHLQLSDPPKPSLEVQTQWLDAFLTERMEMKCGVQGSSDWTFTWYRDGQKLSEDSAVSLNAEGMSLTILSAAQTHAGLYTCKSHHKTRNVSSGPSNSADITVHQNIPKSTLKKSPGFDQMYVRESINFSCAVDVFSGWEYLWFKDGKQLITSDSSKSYYAISSPAPSDGGMYTCKARRGKHEFFAQESSNVSLNIIEIPVPSLELQTPWLDVFPTERVEMNCGVQGSSDWTYTWYRDGHELSGDHISVSPGAEGSSLVISSAKPGDAGTYTCGGQHRTRPVKTQSNNTPILIVYANKPKPLMIQDPSAEKMYFGEPVFFGCKVEVSTGWEYLWYKDGTPLSNNSDSYYNISSATPSDSGSYKCKAKRGTTAFDTDYSEVRTLQISALTSESGETTDGNGGLISFKQ